MKRVTGVVVRKYWLTGVLPAFRDGISPLSATTVISMLPQYHGLCGLTKEEVEAIAKKYLASTHTLNHIKSTVALMKSWYDGYVFCPPGHDKSLSPSRLFNPQLVFTHLRAVSLKSAWLNPRKEANATHSAIVLSAITGQGITSFDLATSLSGNIDVSIMTEFGPRELKRLGQDHNLTWSLLYYLGVITHNDDNPSMCLPNASMRFLVSTSIPLACVTLSLIILQVMERLSGYLQQHDSDFQTILAACGAFVEGNFTPFVNLLERFLQSRSARSARDSKEPALQSIVELCWFGDGRCVPEMCLVADPAKQWGHGRFGFVDILIASLPQAPSVRMPVIELKSVNLRSLWKGPRLNTVGEPDEPSHEELLALRNKLKNESEEQLLKRKYAYWSEELRSWRVELIEELKGKAFMQVTRYLGLIQRGEAEGSTAGILDDRVRCINGKGRLDGYVLLCIGDTRVLGWHTGTEQTRFVLEKW
jgi:hypothetical protein